MGPYTKITEVLTSDQNNDDIGLEVPGWGTYSQKDIAIMIMAIIKIILVIIIYIMCKSRRGPGKIRFKWV
ncbi:TPA_asm: P6 [Ficus alphacytorhabdovirus 1]|nr:TPA_asm: P6 [Ficus alphacytorhabdovirus 1]